MMGSYRMATKLLALATFALGVVIFAIGAIHGGSAGMLIGALFALAGAGRLWMIRKRYG